MKVSDIIRIGDKIDIRVLQEVEQAEKTDVTVKTYKSKVLDFCSNGNMEIATVSYTHLTLPTTSRV